MPPPYDDAVVIVTGAPTGLGRAVAVGAARQGARAIIVNYASRADRLKPPPHRCVRPEPRWCWLKVTSGRMPTVAAAERYGRIDALFNNAGTSKINSYANLDGLDADDFLRIYRINVVGPQQMVRAAQALLESSDRATVVMASSIAGLTGGGSSIAYASSKGALNALTFGLARAVAPKVRVNAICPDYIDSPWFDRLGYEGGKGRLAEHMAKTTPLKVASQPEDVAETALFLGSPAARHVTGETLLVDAGLHLVGS